MLGAGLFQGKIRAVVSTLGGPSRGMATDKVVIKPGQMKLFYVLDGKVLAPLQRRAHPLEAGDSALLDGGAAALVGKSGPRRARALWVILG